jgi:hypothetical protein
VSSISPSHPRSQVADAQLYADNVRREMAAAARLPCSAYGARELRAELAATKDAAKSDNGRAPDLV